MNKLILFCGLMLVLSACKKETAIVQKDCGQLSSTHISGNNKRILFLGLDGTRTDALLAANTPTIDSLANAGLRHWHVDRGVNTVSVPGWSTILHGVMPAKHGLTVNNFAGNHYDEYPDMLSHIGNAIPGLNLYTISHWQGFLDITSGQNYCYATSNDDELTAKADTLLTSFNPDVLLVHFDGPDDEGHSTGFSPNNAAYLKAIESCDKNIKKILERVKHREQTTNEQWMIVMCTDHGGEGKGHGGQDNLPQTRYVWYIVTGQGITPAELTAPSANTDLMPTMLKYIGIAADTSWHLDGITLY
jgi:predicted AlkP superfamily pyrophosphatase or phosphodiesterase